MSVRARKSILHTTGIWNLANGDSGIGTIYVNHLYTRYPIVARALGLAAKVSCIQVNHHSSLSLIIACHLFATMVSMNTYFFSDIASGAFLPLMDTVNVFISALVACLQNFAIHHNQLYGQYFKIMSRFKCGNIKYYMQYTFACLCSAQKRTHIDRENYM